MALIRLNNFIEEDNNQTNSVELMASWQLWLSNNEQFIRLNAGDNSLRIAPSAFFAFSAPFRWFRVVEFEEIITQSALDVGGNYKADTLYHLFLVDDEQNGRFSISENEDVPLGASMNNALHLAQFRTGNSGVIDANSIYDIQMRKIYEVIYPVGHEMIQLPTQSSPQERWPFLEWADISDSYAGDFLRVAGGLANEFGQGAQEESLPNIVGSFALVGVQNQGTSDAIYSETGGNSTWQGLNSSGNQSYPRFRLDASRSHPAYGRREEVAPKNQSIRIWRRIGVIIGQQNVIHFGVQGEFVQEQQLPVDAAGIIGFNANCMTIEPLPKTSKSRAKKEEVVVFNRFENKWMHVIDHRGKVAYSQNGRRLIRQIGDDLQENENWSPPSTQEEALSQEEQRTLDEQ